MDDLIQKCLYRFDLHGSRYFAARWNAQELIKEDTDWDFFVADCNQTTNVLLEMGFWPAPANPEYLDESTRCVWVHSDYPNIQVVQKRLYDEYKEWRNNTTLWQYVHFYHKGSIKQRNPAFTIQQIKKQIRDNLNFQWNMPRGVW